MLGELRRSELIFPRLLHIRETALESPTKRKGASAHKRLVHLFRLDWAGWERRIRARWDTEHGDTVAVREVEVHSRLEAVALAKPRINQIRRFVRKVEQERGRKPQEFDWALPEKWNKLVHAQTYALDGHYLDGIRHAAKMARDEWDYAYRFDTIIREECLRPAIEFVWTAFMLLSDCIHDATNKRFTYDFGLKYSILHAMVYKVWDHQTGRGCMWDNAKLDRALVHADHMLARVAESNDPRARESDWMRLRTLCIELEEVENAWCREPREPVLPEE